MPELWSYKVHIPTDALLPACSLPCYPVPSVPHSTSVPLPISSLKVEAATICPATPVQHVEV